MFTSLVLAAWISTHPPPVLVAQQTHEPASSTSPLETRSRAAAPEEEQQRAASSDVVVAAVGDVLLDAALHRQGQGEGGFRSLWKAVEAQLGAADLAYANLEGPLAGGKTSGFPRFNHPDRLAQDLRASGFDVVSTANNHALDRGVAGLDRTLDLLDDAGLAHAGTRHSQRDTDSFYTVLERKGLRVAFVACTFETNGKRDARRQVLFCYRDRAVLSYVVRDLNRRKDVDAVIVTPHFGLERLSGPRPKERLLARSLIEAGALAVLGAHPHKLWEAEHYRAKNGQQGFIAYSLGNFVSGQRSLKQRTGAMLQLTLRRTRGAVVLQDVAYLPLVTTVREGVTRVEVAGAESAEGRHAAKVLREVRAVELASSAVGAR